MKLLLVMVVLSLRIPAATCDVREFGAKGDGVHLDTAAIQSAIEACAQRGGGVVEFGPGTYLSGSIELKDNITLSLEPGSRLLGSSDVKRYSDVGRASEERSTALIWAIGAHNISLRRSGVIDGNGRSFTNQNTPHRTGAFDPKATRQGEEAFRRFSENREGPVATLPRPGVLVLFIQCEQVDIREIHVVDAPNWCIHLACCKHAAVIGIVDVRNSLLIPNADALDVSNCQDVRISDVYLEAGDDGIAISPCADGYCQQTAENITVSNAVIVSRSAGIRLGWSANDIRNLVFNNIVIRDSNRGIGIFVRGKEKIEHVLFSNMVVETRLVDSDWWGMGEPLHVSVVPWKFVGEQGSVSDLRLVNVTATSDAPILLYADKPGHIRNVLLDDVSLQIAAGPFTARYGGNLDLRPTEPVKRGITSYDMAGLKAENIDDLVMRNFRLRWTQPVPDFFRSGVEVVNSHDLDIDGFSGAGPAKGTPAISLAWRYWVEDRQCTRNRRRFAARSEVAKVKAS